MTTITAESPWRLLRDVPYSTWRNAILGAGGPPELASKTSWKAAQPHSAMLLNLLRSESNYGQRANRNKPLISRNPFSLRRYNTDGTVDAANEDNVNGYLHFATFWEGVQAARLRITDPAAFRAQTYRAESPYEATHTIGDFFGVYSPPAYNDTQRIIRETVNYLRTLPSDDEQGDDDMTVTFGRVPMPPYERRIVENSRAWNDLGKRTIRGVVWHRMYGTLWGTDTYFRGAAVDRALTDYGVGVAATDGAANDGRAFLWCDPAGRRSPWANGPVTNPRNDGKAFIALYGINATQRDLASIEISGNGDTALSAKARAWIVAATAYYADQYHVSHETFPLIPSEGGRSYVIWHGEINGGKWGTCPGPVVEAETNAMIAEVKATLKRYQESAAPEYATPQPVDAGTRVINDRLFVGVDKAYTIRRTTTPRLWADPSSPATGADLEDGDIVTVSHMVEDVGEASGLTLVLDTGSRIPALALMEGGE